MVFFLKLVGAVFVALLLLIVVGFFYLKYKIKKTFGGFLEKLQAAGAAVPPFRIRLTPVVDREEFAEDRSDVFETLTGEIEQIGFQHIGDFQSDAGFAIAAFLFADRKTYAVIYEHYAAGVWADIVRQYGDRTTWTYTTCKEHGTDTMPGNITKFLPEMPIADVVELFWSESPTDDLVNVLPTDFAKLFQQIYADEMNWNMKRGGPTEKEIRRVSELSGEECTPEKIRSIQDAWGIAISDFLSECAITQCNRETNVSRADAEHREHRIFAVHDRMPNKDLLQNIFEDFYIDEDDDDVDQRDPEEQKWRATLDQVRQLRKSQTVIEIAEHLIKNSNEAERYEYIHEVSTPIKARIWLRPDYDQDEEIEAEVEAFKLD